jgi:hypothetical protein
MSGHLGAQLADEAFAVGHYGIGSENRVAEHVR